MEATRGSLVASLPDGRRVVSGWPNLTYSWCRRAGPRQSKFHTTTTPPQRITKYAFIIMIVFAPLVPLLYVDVVYPGHLLVATAGLGLIASVESGMDDDRRGFVVSPELVRQGWTWISSCSYLFSFRLGPKQIVSTTEWSLQVTASGSHLPKAVLVYRLTCIKVYPWPPPWVRFSQSAREGDNGD